MIDNKEKTTGNSPLTELPDELLPAGTRIRFTKDLTADATGDHPALQYAEIGETGVITGHGCSEGYWVKTDRWPTPFGASRDEFEELAAAEVTITKHRRDLTPEDFRILKRFKQHLHRLATSGKVELREWVAPVIYEQAWCSSGAGWREHSKKECLNCLCYVLDMHDFRDIVRAVIKDIGAGTEAFIVSTLRRLSMVLFKEDRGHWKWNSMQEVVLEYERLSPEGIVCKLHSR